MEFGGKDREKIGCHVNPMLSGHVILKGLPWPCRPCVGRCGDLGSMAASSPCGQQPRHPSVDPAAMSSLRGQVRWLGIYGCVILFIGRVALCFTAALMLGRPFRALCSSHVIPAWACGWDVGVSKWLIHSNMEVVAYASVVIQPRDDRSHQN